MRTHFAPNSDTCRSLAITPYSHSSWNDWIGLSYIKPRTHKLYISVSLYQIIVFSLVRKAGKNLRAIPKFAFSLRPRDKNIRKEGTERCHLQKALSCTFQYGLHELWLLTHLDDLHHSLCMGPLAIDRSVQSPKHSADRTLPAGVWRTSPASIKSCSQSPSSSWGNPCTSTVRVQRLAITTKDQSIHYQKHIPS